MSNPTTADPTISPLVLVKQPTDFGEWSTKRLTYDHQASCWSIEIYAPCDPGELTRRDRNPGLSSPADVDAAQQWAASKLTPSREQRSGVGWDPSTWTVTEWQPIDVDGRISWVALYDYTDVADLPFTPRNPHTGICADPAVDSLHRVRHPAGAGNPIGTELDRATPADRRAVARLIGRTLAGTPQAEWLVPDPKMRADVLADYAGIAVHYALTSGHGHIDVIREHPVDPLLHDRTKVIVAAAVWLYHDGPAPAPTAYAARRRRACQQWDERFAHFDAALAAHHPDIPHHHLPFLAVDPARRSAGLGTLLIRAHLALLAPSGTAVYAPAATPTARAFYRRHGLHHRLPFPLPAASAQQPAGEPIWPCLRQPNKPATASRTLRPPGTSPPTTHGVPARYRSA